MNIVLFNGQVWDSTWGHHKNFVAALAQRHQVYVVDLIDYALRYASKLQGKTYPAPEGVTVLKRRSTLRAGILFGIYTEFRNVLDLMAAMRRFAPEKTDIVVSYLTSGVILALCLAKCLGKKIVLIYADDYAEFLRNKSPIIGWFTEHIGTPIVARLCDRIITTAHKLQEDLAPFHSQITVIPNGVHIEQFQSYHHRMSSKIRDNSRDVFTVGFVGGFGSWVDFEMVLRAAEALPHIQFKLIGSGDQFEMVRQRVASLKNVWAPGILPHHQIPTQLASMDIGLIPFKINRITDRVSPVKLFEYWAMGKPVISTRFYEIQKVAEEKVFFVDTSEDLQKMILRLQQAPEERHRMAQAGLEEVLKYDWQTLCIRYLTLFETLA